MPFEAAVSVKEVLGRIEKRDYLLPAIQREFVWGPDQILALIDSLMRGYPIGSFLLWEVQPESVGSYTYYNFISDYKERAPYAEKAPVMPGKGITAVLDGQQRLTALNIALRGSHTQKKKGGWASNPDAYVTKHVYLNLAEDPEHEELGYAFDLRFLTKEEAQTNDGEPDKWFRLNDVFLLTDSGPSIVAEVAKRGLDVSQSYGRLHALYEAIVTSLSVNWYLEKSQDADKVLDIFVRVNSGGTPLSYSDLLLSMATNQWDTLDAREEVRSLVSDLNGAAGRDFDFTKDNILKSALMISDLPLRFAVSTFTKENMAIVEKNWDLTKRSLLSAAALLKSFGFSSQNLSAHSVIVVLAHYMSKVDSPDTYVESSYALDDRREVKTWLIRTLLKQGVWGSGLDTLLSRLRLVISDNSTKKFPAVAIEASMSQIGKSLAFEKSELDEVLSARYGTPKAFAVLSLLYPGLDFTSQFHQDHIFPKSQFTDKALKKLGIESDQVGEYQERFDTLPNLQLLKGQINVEKQAKLPAEWLDSLKLTDEELNQYLRTNDLDGLQLDFNNFIQIFEGRRQRMLTRLNALLGQ